MVTGIYSTTPPSSSSSSQLKPTAGLLHTVCSETYEYYKLPYCKPKAGVRYKTLGMGEVVDANRMATTPYQLNFRTDRKDEVICEKTLSDDDMIKFRKVGWLVDWG